MPQSTGTLPAAICLRASMTRATVGCSLKPSGAVVTLSESLCSSASGTCVSAASVHFEPRNGAQSTANFDLKFDSTGLTVCLPGVERVAVLLDHLLRLCFLDDALRDELVGVELARARMLRDLLVHQRLRHRGLVLLVVAELAEADDVDHHVLVERLPEIEREARDEQHRLGVVAVHVEDRRLDHLRHVGAVDAWSAYRAGRRS